MSAPFGLEEGEESRVCDESKKTNPKGEVLRG